MAAFCVNTNSKLFRDTAKRLGVSEFELEQIAYKYGNQEGTFGQFPSDEYIKEQLDGVPNYNASEAQAELWKLRYSTPREFDTLEELNAAKEDALQYFDDNSIRSFVNADGKYELRIGKQEALENPETELKKTEEEARSITRRIVEIEKQLRSKNIYENTISTSDGEIRVTISDSSKDSGEDKIWLSSGKSILGAVSMSIESNLKNGTIGGSIIFPSDAINNRGNNYQRLNNPIRRNHAEILKSVLKYFIDNGKSYPASKWMEGGELSSEIAALSEVFKIDLSPYFKVERRVKENKYNDEYDIEEQRVVVDAEKLYQALNFVSNGSNMSSITEALEYNEAYNVASKIGFGKDNRRNREQLENELRSANKERDALWNKIRSLKDEVRRMKSSPWAFDVEEDLPFQKSPEKESILKDLEKTLTQERRLSRRSWLTAHFDEDSGILTISSYDSGADWDSTAYYKLDDNGEVVVSSDNINFKSNPKISSSIKDALQKLKSNNVTGLPDQMTANEAFQILSKQYAPDSSEAKLSKLVFDALQKTGITFKAADLPMGVRGRFSASDNAILFSKDGILNNTLLHEAIHAVSIYYMSAANREGFSNEIKIAIREIEECYDLLKEYLLDKETKNGGNRDAIFGYLTSGFGGYYGLSSATELVAEITNPDIVALIKEFDATHKGQNIFKRLIDAIAKFFGINKTYGSLEKTLKDALATLIENPNAELMQRYALENKTLKDNYHALDSAEKAIIFGARKQANEAFENAEFNDAGEYETILVVPLDSVRSGYVYEQVAGAHNELTQSPVGAIFKMYSGEGFGTFLLNGSVVVSERDNTVSIPVKAINKSWLQTHTFDIATSENGVAYMTNIKPLFSATTQSSFVQNAEFYSGAAAGSDRAWGTEARKLGIKVRDYTRADWAGLSQEWKNRLSAEYESVARDLGRNVIPLGGRGDIEVRRDMMQADKADAIFAIGRPVKPGERGAKYINRSNHEVVDGGTGYAVQRGIQRGIPVYLYDRVAKQWKMWDANTGSFVATEEPVLTPHAAVIGTRGDYYADRQEYDITEEEKGVIRSVLQKTLNQQQAPQQQSPINIWAGSNENADLSNFAFRPFTLPMNFRLPNGTFANIPWKIVSVEAAFQALKSNYTKAGTLEEEAENNKIRESILGNTRLSALEHGRRVKTLGRNFRNFDSASWERDKAVIMKTLIKESFKQNPQALQRLLDTGDAVFTHNQESSIWKTEFPRILMEVRSELREEQGTALGKQVATQGTTQQYGVVIDSQLKSNYTQWQQQNPNGLVAYRVNFNKYNTPEEATAGRIGNPFSEGQGQTNKGVDTVQKFFEWLTTGNNFGEAKATEEYRQAIIQKLLNTPVGTPILYYTELGRPSHATILGYLINHKELIGGQQERVETQEQEPLLAPPSVEREFHTKEVDLVTKIDNLFSGDIDASEISAEANKAVDWISDQLTQYMEDHELVYKKFFEDNPSSSSKEEVMKKLAEVSSRREMLETVGLDKMIEFYKEEVLSMTDENADIFDNMDDAELDKYDAIKDNIEGLIQLGYSRFLGREGFGFTISDVEGETFSVTEERSKEDQINPDDFNGQADIDGNEEVRNQQEHWQIENATRDIMDNASAKVKQAIADCYILEDNGKVDENGNKKYDIARDNLNRNERVVPIQAVRSIVKWTQGALTLSQMVAKLEARLGTDPWISQIVTRLKDTTGNEADFQSQFFNTFCKHFQPYSIVKRRADGTFYTMVVNAHPALNDALNALSIQYKTGAFPLVNEEGIVQMSNVETLAALRDTLQGQGNLSEENRSNVVELIGRILETIGMPQPSDAINRILTNTLKDLVWANTKNIVEKLTAAAGEKGYNPFQYTGNKNGIRNYISNILRPFTNQLEDTLVSSVFDSGKMYQSYITPSWTTKLFTKMHLPDREFKQFILNEFGQSEWFIDSDALTNLATLDEQGKLNYLQDNPNIWRLPWIGELMRMSEADRQKAFQHKVQLNFNKQNYMRGMNDLEYVMSVYTEYFAESSDTEKGVLFGNYRFPMISNKPSNEFIRFIRHTGTDGRVEILDGLTKIFHQELSRIQTVEMRNLKEGDAGYIANFDANEGKGKGLQFNFLDYLNEYLNGSKSDTALGKLIDRKLHATEANQLTSDELTELDNLVQKEIKAHLDGLADRLISQYKQNGLFEALKNIEHIGKTDAAVEDAIREFAWNDNYAEANILEMLVTDKAFYNNEEDLQKRLAQVHSPGIRGNWEATDFSGKPVSDGKVRVLKLADYAGIVSDTIDNVEAVFDKKIAENPNDREGWEALKESVLAAYRDINVVDGQAFVSPTAYRKKAIAFGEWTKDDEEVYNALLQGKANLAQIKRVFNPRKPFTYGKVNKSVSAGLGTPIKTLNYGVQYKNSEYLLIMADALLRGQETGRPNLLGALFDVMEESAKSNPTRGIDFVVFESGVKTGLTGAISINEFINDPNGREKAFTKLWNSAFKEDGSYNEDFIDVLDAEDYTTQQTVPEHFFLHGGLQWGSQIRAMATSDLETTFNGEPVLYEYVDPLTGKTIPMDARTIRDEWERNTAAYIQKGIDELSEELGLNDNMSIADRNILISKLLQREILSNQRYGVDLLLACSVDENGNFRIPLGDPIQSKRIEQLLNSIVKNRINKQKVEGGNLVEVTNFGTSKKLEIRYKDKDGNLLTSKRDYLAQGHTEEEFKKYLKENQYGIAYHECYAPAWARDVFQKFADEKGSVDVEAIRMLSPDLLKMFGYRIPTEDKYSTAPYMIVGFLPQEAGDGFMQPWETTVIDGSDFDVDKKNLMRMVLDLKSKLLSKREFLEQEGLTESDESTEKYKKYRRQAVSAKTIYDKLGDKADVSLSEEERKEIEWYEKSRYKRDRKALKEQRNARNEEAEEAFDRKYSEYGTYDLDKLDTAIQELENKEDLTAAEEKKLAEYKKDYEERYDRLTKSVDKMRENNEKWYKEAVEKRRQKLSENIERAIEDAKRRKKIEIVRNILNEGVFRDSSTIPENQRAIFLAVKQAYLDSMFEVVRPKEGTKGYLNNKMFNMQWAIATHASTADKMLNPGNFNPQKRMGYMVAANRLGYSWSELEKMKTSAIKDLVFTSKNLMDFDVQTQFYKQNAVAGQILGIFAVAKSAHAMFEGRNYGILVDSPFSIDGMEFNGAMHYDVKYDRNGVTLVGKHLGSLVGASADAVKDPVLNFMNINKETINVLNTALRLGLDFDTASLLLSSKAVSDVLDIYRRKSLSEKTSFDKEVRKALRDLEKKDWIGKDSPLKNQDLTKKEMIWAITGKVREGNEEKAKQADQIVYKILNAVYQLSKLSQRAQPLTDLSRLNSVTSAPGPLHINTIASDRKLGPEISMDGIIRFKDSYKDIDGNTVEVGEFDGEGSYVLGVQVNRNNLDRMLLAGAIERFEDYDTVDREMVFDDIPSLRAFYRSYEIVKQLFKDLGFTTASDSFNKVLAAVPEDIEFSLYNKEKLLSSLADFFQSYILIQSGVVKSSWLKNYAQNFVKEYVKADYKSQERFRKNPLIQAIQPTLISKEGEPDRYALKIETTGMEQSEKDALSAGWIQLEKQDPELSHKLFVYNFFRGGIGFNPKTFMGLVPIQVKEKIQGYIEAYSKIPTVDGATVIDQWVRNNWMNNDLVTPVNLKLNPNADVVQIEKKYIYNTPTYIRTTVDGKNYLYRLTSIGDKSVLYKKIDPLGNNGEYLEMYETDATISPFDNPQRGTLEIQESDHLEEKVDNPRTDQPTVEEQTRELVDFYQTAYDTESTQEREETSNDESFDRANKDLDITVNKDKFDEILEDFC